jgi:quercetin dioxygenase-like cupin family protein/uncharacterized glyoxalase superfamily protein PhnB
MQNRSMPRSAVIPVLAYDDVGAAVDWLCAAFSFGERWRVGDHRAQLAVGDGAVAVTERGAGSEAGSIMVQVHDLDAHLEQAERHGARIVAPPQEFPYGERQYTAQDPGGHTWTFSESVADVAPEDWGGASGDLGRGSWAQEVIGDDSGASVSVIVVDAAPGEGPALHRHPYEEIFVVLEGEATFTVGDEQRVFRAGDIAVARGGVAHGFVDSGGSRLVQVDVHLHPRFQTEWLD